LRRPETPCYVVDARALERNLAVLRGVADATGCRILLAQKAFSMFRLYPLIGRYLSGAASSGLYEARLAREAMGEAREVHVYAPAFKDDEFDRLLGVVDVIVFNTFEQWERFRDRVRAHNASGGRPISCGLRVNPGYSEVDVPLYDPARPDSRLGVGANAFREGVAAGRFDGLDGVHFHSLCEQGADVLDRTIAHMAETFGPSLPPLRWINLGGGHHITRADYDLDLLHAIIRRVEAATGARVYLEPGEAVALDAGWLVAEVLDVMQTDGGPVAILDASAACHMPDVLEMPYTPRARLLPLDDPTSMWAGTVGRGKHSVTLAGPTCLAGDIIGTYDFGRPLVAGDRVMFEDMAIYTMVKNNTFNGMPLPSIVLIDRSGEVRTVRSFTYDDFKMRLG
jgi:carboxynorspermidine decarboxylase